MAAGVAGAAIVTNRFDRSRIRFRPLAERRNKHDIRRDAIDPYSFSPELSPGAEKAVSVVAEDVVRARGSDKPVILAFGAHAIKNGLGPVLIALMDGGWVTHLATNGAGIIHDWEFAFQGYSGEDVRAYVEQGQFGIWQETGLYLNLAFSVGAYRGLGYGASVGALVEKDGLEIPTEQELADAIRRGVASDASTDDAAAAAAAADLLATVRRLQLSAGFMRVAHPFREIGVQAAAYRLELPFTGHPMIGHDIIYTHPANCCAAIGRTAERDFLSFTDSVSRLEGGAYLSVGSAIMSPMIFEKALSMSRNVAIQRGETIQNFSIFVVDLAEPGWDWIRDGEPPTDNPAYYLRFLKTFSRMGGRMSYVGADNRSFLVALLRALAG